MTYKEAMASVDKEQWDAAVKKEHDKMKKYNVFRVVNRKDLPPGTKLFDLYDSFESYESTDSDSDSSDLDSSDLDSSDLDSSDLDFRFFLPTEEVDSSESDSVTTLPSSVGMDSPLTRTVAPGVCLSGKYIRLSQSTSLE